MNSCWSSWWGKILVISRVAQFSYKYHDDDDDTLLIVTTTVIIITATVITIRSLRTTRLDSEVHGHELNWARVLKHVRRKGTRSPPPLTNTATHLLYPVPGGPTQKIIPLSAPAFVFRYNRTGWTSVVRLWPVHLRWEASRQWSTLPGCVLAWQSDI